MSREENSKKCFIPPRVGILGGGQLALMLAEAAIKMGLRPLIFADSSTAPATRVCPDAVFGSMEDSDALRWFFSQVDHVIFENEFVDCEKLRRAALSSARPCPWPESSLSVESLSTNSLSSDSLASDSLPFDSSPGHVQFFPGLRAIEVVQDKLRQKELFEKLKIPTAAYFQLDLLNGQSKSLKAQLKSLLDRFGGACVLKWARMGYDGKGVFQLKNTAESLSLAEEFCKRAEKTGGAVYAEQKILFSKELAIVGVYSTLKEWVCYPLVISEQQEGVCSRVIGPAQAFGASADQEALARKYAERIARALDLHGAFALEFFEDSAGNLILNEVAPRVHNSGHYSQDACATSQFENHWRAVLGWPLGKVDPSPGFAMLNILGPETGKGALRGRASEKGRDGLTDRVIEGTKDSILPIPGPRSHLHWYGKVGVQPKRKLGHLNGTVSQASEINSLLDELEKAKEEWAKHIGEFA